MALTVVESVSRKNLTATGTITGPAPAWTIGGTIAAAMIGTTTDEIEMIIAVTTAAGTMRPPSDACARI